jgi:hypothetical protein
VIIVRRSYEQMCFPQLAGVGAVVVVERRRVLSPAELEHPGEPRKTRARHARTKAKALPHGQDRQESFWKSDVVGAKANPEPAHGTRKRSVPSEIARCRRPAVPDTKPLGPEEVAFKRELDSQGANPAGIDTRLPTRPTSDLQCVKLGLGSAIPCPYVGCKNHLSVEVTQAGGLRTLYPHWHPKASDDEPTCSLVEARKGCRSSADVGKMFGVTPDRVTQIIAGAIAKLARELDASRDDVLDALRELSSG